jgi:hypothetical protein
VGALQERINGKIKSWASDEFGMLTLESLDDEGRSGGDDVDLCLTVLDGELDGNTETLPCASRLCDIFTDLFR